MDSQCRVRPEALDAYFHGMLNEAQHREISAHLLTCAVCNQALGALESEAYTIGKGLRDVQIPAMSISAANLVARYVGTQAPDSTTVELSTIEHARLEERTIGRKAPVKHLTPVLPNQPLHVRLLAGPLETAWALALSRTLRYAAVFALVCAAAGWSAMWIVRRFDQMNARLAEYASDAQKLQKMHEDERIAGLLRDRDSDRRFNDWNEAVFTPIQQRLVQMADLTRERDKAVDQIAKLNGKINELEAKVNQNEANAADIAQLKQEMKQAEQNRIAKDKELAANSERIKEISKRPEAALLDPDALALLAKDEDAITWEELKDAQSLANLRDHHGEAVGWAVSLSQMRPAAVNEGELTPGAPRPGVGDFPLFAGPASGNGKVYVGNGWNGNVLMGFDGATGQQAWTFQASETGIGNPVLSDDGQFVYFTTKSQVYAVQTSNGKLRWGRPVYLGDVSTQPALNRDYIFVVHENKNSPPGLRDNKGAFSLTCLLARDGKGTWSQPLDADAISAPVVVESGGHERIIVATRDGKISIVDANGMNLVTCSAPNAASAPVLSDGTMYVTSWSDNSQGGFDESLMKLKPDGQGNMDALTLPFPAAYLSPLKTAGTMDPGSPEPGRDLTASLADRSAIPAFRQAWSYMGAHPTVVDNTAYLAIGDRLISVDVRRGKLNWSKKVVGQADTISVAGQGQPALTPPSYANGHLYLGSVWGDMLCVDAATGSTTWRYRLPASQGVTSQVTLDQGLAYATTTKGSLICIDTRDSAATGWTNFGGSASHNGAASVTPASHVKLK